MLESTSLETERKDSSKSNHPIVSLAVSPHGKLYLLKEPAGKELEKTTSLQIMDGFEKGVGNHHSVFLSHIRRRRNHANLNLLIEPPLKV